MYMYGVALCSTCTRLVVRGVVPNLRVGGPSIIAEDLAAHFL